MEKEEKEKAYESPRKFSQEDSDNEEPYPPSPLAMRTAAMKGQISEKKRISQPLLGDNKVASNFLKLL